MKFEYTRSDWDNMNGGGVGGVDPLNWYNDIPIVSKVYLTLSFITTAACALDLISPFSLYFNYKLIVTKGQVSDVFLVTLCTGMLYAFWSSLVFVT